MTDDLREALAKIKPGDEVTVALAYNDHTGTLAGKVWEDRDGYLFISGTVIRRPAGAPANDVTAVLDHKPHVPDVTAEVLDALPVWSVVTDHRDRPWVKDKNGLWDGHVTSDHLARHFAPLTIRHPRDGAA